MNSKNTRILITGGMGFLGYQITKQLIKQNYKNIKLVVRKKPKHMKFDRSIKLKLTKDIFSENNSSLKKMLKDIDIVIHTAWYVNPKDYLHSKKNLDCLKGTINLAKAASECKVKKFVGIGTCFEYDTKKKFLSTKTNLSPETLYSACKASTFFILSKFLNRKEIIFKWCRVFYLYGENEKPQRLFPIIQNKLKNNEIINLGEGKQIRDYMDVRDAAKMIINFSMNSKKGAKNICTGIPISIKNFALKVAKKLGKQKLLIFKKKYIKRSFDPNFIVGVK
jgi:nucleoside-diphosphate-sugar epimerase